MKTFALAFAVLGTACAGDVTGGGDDTGGGGSDSVELQIAKQKWHDDAYPIFGTVCYACHGGNGPGPDFVKAAQTDYAAMRQQLLTFPEQVVNLDAPDSSRVLQKGAHSSTPALSDTQHTAILGWLQAEKDAQSATTVEEVIETKKVDLLICTGGTPGVTTGCTSSPSDPANCCPVNTVALGDTMQTNPVPGATISFVAQAFGSSLYLSDIYVEASADGVYLEHPLFLSWPKAGGDEIPDILDRYFDTKLNLAKTTTVPVCPGPSCDKVGAGAGAFVRFDPSNQVSITFKKLESFHPDTTTPPMTVGCGTKGFQSFLTNVKPLMTLCATCHQGQNTSATNNMDLTKLASTTDNNACEQAYAHLQLNSPSNSGLILAPQQGVDATHPAAGKLSGTTNPTFAAWSTAINKWITDEQNE
ncbi:MAG: hypothetical protein QM831_35670 [Kofleriaceae bacterium]